MIMTRLTNASYVKIGLLVLLAIVLCGGIVSCSARCTPSYDFDYSYDDVTMRETGAGSVAGANVQNVAIAWAAGSAIVTVCDDAETNGEVVFTETGSAVRSHPLRWTCENGTLYISYDSLKNGIFGCSSFGSKQLEVKIPRSVAQTLGRFELDVASGDYTVEGLTCQTVKLGVASGTVEATDVVAQNLKADIASGSTSIALPSQSAFELSYDALSGRIDSDFSVRSGTPYAGPPNSNGSTVYGDANAEVTGRFDVDMASGNLAFRKM